MKGTISKAKAISEHARLVMNSDVIRCFSEGDIKIPSSTSRFPMTLISSIRIIPNENATVLTSEAKGRSQVR